MEKLHRTYFQSHLSLHPSTKTLSKVVITSAIRGKTYASLDHVVLITFRRIHATALEQNMRANSVISSVSFKSVLKLF